MELTCLSATTFVLLMCQSILTSVVTARPSAATREEQEDYLKRYAYMGPLSPDPRLGSLTDQNIFKMAVMKFQMMMGINASGIVDEETKKMMEMPRCGVPDEVGMGMVARKRKRRYSALGSRWPKLGLTYRINSFSTDLPEDTIRSEISAAFQHWSNVSPLLFTEVKTKDNVDIDISFAKRSHGDSSSFDGPGGILAHAYSPGQGIGGDAHFDEDEEWTSKKYEGTNFLQVAIHEFGHSLGLGHSKDKDSIMFPTYRQYVPSVQLHPDDIEGITYIYGKKSDIVSEATTRATTTTRSPPPSEICTNPAVDAIFEADSHFHLFKGRDYYKLDMYGILPGYPKPISDEWSGLPNDIDTAYQESGNIYFFKGGDVWCFDRNQRLQSGYPKNISQRFPGIPDSLDAAFIWSGNGRLYFLKGNNYYRTSPSGQVEPNYPFKFNVIWKGLPDKIDAAFNSSSGRTYFFREKNFYRFNDITSAVDKEYPKPTAEWWLHCQSKGSQKDMMSDEWMKAKDQFLDSGVYPTITSGVSQAVSWSFTASVVCFILVLYFT